MQHLVSRIQWNKSFNQQKWEIAQKYRSHTCTHPYVTNITTHNHCMLVLSGDSCFSWLMERMYFALKYGCMKLAHLSYDDSLLSWIWRWEIGFASIHFILIRKEKTVASGLTVTLCAVLTSVNIMFFHSAPMSAVMSGTNHPLSISEWGWPAMNKAFNSFCILFKLKPLISQTHLQLLHGETFLWWQRKMWPNWKD